MLNLKIIGNFLGLLLLLNALFMLLCLPFSFYYNEGDWEGILEAGVFTATIGIILWFYTRSSSSRSLKKRDGYLIVTAGWIVMSASGALPYIFTGSIPSYTDAFFETVSGYTTTGASILTDIEAVPKGILFWRSLTQWIGGMGIIVLTIAILPILGIGGMQLFIAEAPGISPDKLKPRIQDTAKRLWFVYIGLSVLQTILLMFGGMDFFDSVNHAMATMATGGFSTKNASAAQMSPYIQYVLIIFMFVAGVNFTLNYFLFKGKFSKIWANEEFRFYLFFTLFAVVVSGTTVYWVTDQDIEKSFRDALFQVVSIITTTGFVSADYTSWTPFLTVFFFILMFFGGSAGSTAGGVKMVRHVVLLKNSVLELSRQLHPSAMLPVRLNDKVVTGTITFNVMAFFIIYIAVFAISSNVVAMFGVDFLTSIGAVATCLGNIGPGLGKVGPVDNFSHLPEAVKWILSFVMLLGRLELFTMLLLFSPAFWRKF